METPGEDAPRFNSTVVLNEVRKHSVIVDSMLRRRAPRELIIQELVNRMDKLVTQVMRLEGIAPRKVIQKDGKILIWRCPENLIPEDRIQDFRTNLIKGGG